jgi:hypothetical protein
MVARSPAEILVHKAAIKRNSLSNSRFGFPPYFIDVNMSAVTVQLLCHTLLVQLQDRGK